MNHIHNHADKEQSAPIVSGYKFGRGKEGNQRSENGRFKLSHKLSHISFLKRPFVHYNTLLRPRSLTNIRGAERITNRLLYQLSYVGAVL